MKQYYPDYKNSILNVSNSILKHYGVQTKYDTIPELDKELQNNYNHIIYILLDGLGVNIIKEHLSETQALRKYLKKEITSVFPPTTVAATNAVLSGLPPISTGYIGWTQYFKKEDTNLVLFLNEDYYTHEKPNTELREKYLNYKTIYEQINEANPTISTNEFFPAFRPNGSKSFKEEIERVLLLTHNQDKSFNYVYWTEPDLSEHLYGTDSFEVKQVLENLNNDFESLLLNITVDTLVIAIADHGLTNIKEVKLYDHPEVTDLLIRKPSMEPRATAFFVKKDQHTTFKEVFNRHFGENFTLYTKQEILDSKLFGEGSIHLMSEDFIGDFFSISKNNHMFIFDKSNGYLGHHAGLTKDEMIVPLIMYSKSAK